MDNKIERERVKYNWKISFISPKAFLSICYKKIDGSDCRQHLPRAVKLILASQWALAQQHNALHLFQNW